MSTTAALLSVEEFLRLPEKPGFKQELIEGVLVEMPGALVGHEIVKSNFLECLTAWRLENPSGKVLSETLFVMETAACIPDVAFVLTESLARQDRSMQYRGAPELAIEVVSSETAADLEKKVRAYLRGGSRAVWVAYSAQRGVRAFHPDGSSRWLEGDQVLEEPNLLPGFGVPAARLFDGM
jgi:Uma2 family endonuclease